MGSPVTFSGFNQIDWSSVLNAVMAQESQPVTALEKQRTALQSQQTAFTTLATKLSALESAASDLATATNFGGRVATSTNSAAVAISATSAASVGTYDVVVKELARAQTTASTSTHLDADQTAVATGGSLVINGKVVTVTLPASLEKLADTINATEDIGVTATVVSPTPGHYQLVLTGKGTGVDNAFTIKNNLTGGAAPITFTDTDGDGFSGNSDEDNAVSATNALATINNIQVSSGTNTIESAIPGATISLLQKDPAATVTLSVTQDLSSTKTQVKSFVSAFNDLTTFANSQSSAASKGETGTIGRDALLRGLRGQLRSDLNGAHVTGSKYTYLSQIGLGFDRTGTLTFDEAKFDEAMKSGVADVQKLFAGTTSADGAFTVLQSRMSKYTEAGGLVPDAKNRVDSALASIGSRIDTLNARLALRRDALSKEYIAADQVMTALNNSISSLSSLSGQYRLF
jgi:flagellar hook-associated protein 2